MISVNDLRVHVIRPALYEMELYSKDAEELLLAIAAHESHLGFHLAQVKGPALGIYQMEPATYNDLWDGFLGGASRHYLRLIALNPVPDASRMIYDLRYATKMARLFLLRIPEQLPDSKDIKGMASYWKKYWNTSLGKGEVDVFIKNYERLILGAADAKAT